MVFETERTDKQSLYRRSLEVNAVMSAVPKLMYWSEQAIWLGYGGSSQDYAKPQRVCASDGSDIC
jgi:hypothetical protein